MKLCGRHYATGQALEIEIQAERVAAIRSLDHADASRWQTPCDPCGDGPPWIAPGFVDLQINGYGGIEFSSPSLTVDGVAAVAASVGRMGVTQFLPTMTTAGGESLRHAARTIAVAVERDDRVAALVAGIHLEGPYISAIDGPRGAHPREHCRPPDWAEFQQLQQAAGGRIRLVTLAPEHEGACEFIRRLVDTGVVAAIGHTGATCDEITAAVDSGAVLSTHLGNGCHATLPRHPNYLWTQLADDRLTASLIADGHHLPPEVVKSFVRAKGPGRCVLVSDLSAYAGMPPGEYATELGRIELLPEGKLVVAGQRQFLAGAALPIGVCVALAMQMAGVDRASAVEMASSRPAALVGARSGGLVVGDMADLTLFDLAPSAARAVERFVVRQTICRGRSVGP